MGGLLIVIIHLHTVALHQLSLLSASGHFSVTTLKHDPSTSTLDNFCKQLFSQVAITIMPECTIVLVTLKQQQWFWLTFFIKKLLSFINEDLNMQQ